VLVVCVSDAVSVCLHVRELVRCVLVSWCVGELVRWALCVGELVSWCVGELVRW
jgi:hypothetical protein